MDNSKLDYFKRKLLEKVEKCISKDDIEKLSEKDIDDVINDTNLKKYKTYFNKLPKDIINEITSKCKPEISIRDLNMPINPRHPVEFDLIIENRFGSHLLWINFYRNNEIEFTRDNGILFNGAYLSDIASIDIEEEGGYSSMSINFFINEFKKIAIDYGKHFKINIAKFLKQLESNNFEF